MLSERVIQMQGKNDQKWKAFFLFFCAKLIKSLFIADFCDTFHIWISEPVTGLSGGKKRIF